MDHRFHFERRLEANDFVFIQDINLIIGTVDISGLIFLNLLSE